jgi:uncharacterized protein (DUF2235 family)
MPRNFVLCCDGTDNQFGPQNTSVVRLAQVVERDPHTQLLYYDPGVGTLPEPGVFTRVGKRISELFGLAFGAGLAGKVEEAYSYLMDFWEPGDRVFLFGFSRGAYTVRVLAGMLHALGLLPRGNHNLVPYVMRLFKSVRGKRDYGEGDEKSNYWRLCNQFRWTFARPVPGDDDARRFRVHFVGVWDTVSSVGWVWDPAKYPYTARNPSIDVIRHAVSIDERRWFFRQNLMQPSPGQDFQELWFPGVHGDVGGGYAEKDGGLWRVPFDWMLTEAAKAGLLVNPDRLHKVLNRTPPSEHPWDDPQHESLTAAWWPAEFFPKLQWREGSSWRVPRIGLGRHRFIHDGALIHGSALRRVREISYTPPNFSPVFLEKIRGLADVPEMLPFQR